MEKETEILHICYKQLDERIPNVKQKLQVSDVLFYLGTYHREYITKPSEITKDLFKLQEFSDFAISKTRTYIAFTIFEMENSKEVLECGSLGCAPALEVQASGRIGSC